MKTSVIEMGKGVVIGLTLAAWCAALPAPSWADQPRRTPEQIAENIRKMEERFRQNDRADAERLQKSLADAAERARKKEDERLLAQLDAAEKLGANTSPTGVMVRDKAGNWVNADRSGRPLPPPEPPRRPFDPKAKEAAEKKVKEAFERDHQKALEDQAKRDKEAEDKAVSIMNIVGARNAQVTIDPAVIQSGTNEITVTVQIPMSSNALVTPRFSDNKLIQSSVTLRTERVARRS